MNTYLFWFRDRGHGQEAADALGAIQELDGSWPVAKLEVSNDTKDRLWRYLFDAYGINSMFCQHINPGDRPVTIG